MIDYTTVANFLQGFVDNEANLNPERSCSSQCSDYKQTKHFQCETGSLCDTNEGNNKPNLRCNGIIRDCSEIDSSDVVLCLNHVSFVPLHRPVFVAVALRNSPNSFSLLQR